MDAINTYGDFDLPEEKTEIEVVENPIKFICSTYDLFKTKIKKLITNINWICPYNDETAEKVYECAHELLNNDKTKLVKEKDLEEILKYLEKNTFGLGVFISAFHNLSQINTFVLDKFRVNLDYIGYRLASNKNLIVGPNISANTIGHMCEGNLVNYGIGEWFGSFCVKGIHINQGNCKNHSEEIDEEGIKIVRYETKDLFGIIKINKSKIGFARQNIGDDKKNPAYTQMLYLSQNTRIILPDERFAHIHDVKDFSKIDRTLNQDDFRNIVTFSSFEDHKSYLDKILKFDWNEFKTKLEKAIEETQIE